MKLKFTRATRALAAVVLASTATTLFSATISWDGDTNTDFEEGTNWVGDVAPADDISMDIAQLVGGTVDVSVSRSVASLDLVTSSSTLTGTGTTLTLGGGLSGDQNLTLSGSVNLGLHGVDTSAGYTGDIFIGSGATLTSQRNSIKHGGRTRSSLWMEERYPRTAITSI